MDCNMAAQILASLGFPAPVTVTPFTREEDSDCCNVWKLDAPGSTTVLKKITPREKATLEAFFPQGGCGTPRIYGFVQYEGDIYLLSEFFSGGTLSHSNRKSLTLALDALIQIQEQYWGNTALCDAGWTFDEQYAALQKRLPYMEDLADAYSAYLEVNRSVPRTLCNDDLLPFNVLANEEQAVILDWELGGILPYLCALARFLAFGEENTDFLFQMTRADKEFAIDYYYDRLLQKKGISHAQYLHDLKLFFFKEYSEWVYLARSTGDFSSPYYKKYYPKAKALAIELGLYK